MSTNDTPATPAAPGTDERRPAPSLPEDMLIVLPVRNLVLFPGVILPVAMKREKTVAGAQEAVRNRSQGGLPAAEEPGDRGPGLRRAAPHRHDGGHRPLHHRARRHAPPRLPGRAALPRARRRDRLPVPRGAGRVPQRLWRRPPGGGGPRPAPQADGHGGDLAAAAGAGRTRQLGAGHRVAGHPRRHDCELPRRQACGEAAAPRSAGPARAPRAGGKPAVPPRRGAAAVAPDRAADQGRDRRPPARDRAARAAAPDPEGTR